jgi:MraZ protein
MSETGGSGSIPRYILGTDSAEIDARGRILVSKKKRERLGEGFVLAFTPTGCLAAYPEERWVQKLNEIEDYHSINQGREQFSRLLMMWAEDDLSFDAQGRVVIPQKLRELAKLREKVLLIGCGDRLEIWAEEEWEQYNTYPDTYGQQRREAIQKAYTQMTGRPAQP